MKMWLTQEWEGTRMVVTGDLTQVNLTTGLRSGLRDALDTLEGVQGIGVVRLGTRDVVRHPLVARVVKACDQRAAAEGDKRREARGAARVEGTGESAIEPAASSGPAQAGFRERGRRHRCGAGLAPAGPGCQSVAARAARAAGARGRVVLAAPTAPCVG